MAEGVGRRVATGLLLGTLAGAALAGVFLLAQRPPAGPVPVAWDQTPCTRCRMLVSEPRFAAQLRTDAGVLFFDDPGCLLLWDHEHPGQARATYFHHLDEDRWVDGDEVAFVPVTPTPMGYGLGARDAAQGGMDWDAALRQALARDAARSAGEGRHAPRP